ncbi:hypothetical protein SNEBB_010358 [Seison nebaliae]|nr:hypothetical protein SNEBB_010358 [Seison nebaliae]
MNYYPNNFENYEQMYDYVQKLYTNLNYYQFVGDQPSTEISGNPSTIFTDPYESTTNVEEQLSYESPKNVTNEEVNVDINQNQNYEYSEMQQNWLQSYNNYWQSYYWNYDSGYNYSENGSLLTNSAEIEQQAVNNQTRSQTTQWNQNDNSGEISHNSTKSMESTSTTVSSSNNDFEEKKTDENSDVIMKKTKRMANNKRLPEHARKILEDWWRVEGVKDPYPSSAVKEELMKRTGLQEKQVNYWINNARRRRKHAFTRRQRPVKRSRDDDENYQSPQSKRRPDLIYTSTPNPKK